MILPSTILPVVAESAARALLLAAGVGAGLLLLRTRNVPARKAAWMLVLAASFAMPLLAHWAATASWIPQNAAFLISGAARRSSTPQPASAAPVLASANSFTASPAPHFVARESVARAAGVSHFPAPVITHSSADAPTPAASSSRHFNLSFSSGVLILYLAVCGGFLLRIAYGLWAAAYLWSTATPVDLGGNPSRLRLRSSPRIASPVTVGSGIVLPISWRGWDREKLRIVVAHEASHVRQGDFYLQLATSLYAAIFWFSPLGWWLKRILADLAETISDRAAVELAASHASYAQVLLEFAALPRPIPIGVAMAHHGRIVPRIERLLNESSFRQSFAGGRGRIAAAILLVVAAAFGSTALVRVQAAQVAPPPVAAPAQSPTPAAAPQSPSAAPAPATIAPIAPIVPQEGLAPVSSVAPIAPISTQAPIEASAPAPPTEPGEHTGTTLHTRHGYTYGFNSNGDSYAIAGKNANNYESFSGNWDQDIKGDLARARAMANGDFLWFKHDGKAYIVDDPTIVAQLKAMYQPMEELGKQQSELGKQQSELGRKQSALGHQHRLASVPTPDMTKALAEVDKTTAALKAARGQNLTQEKLADMQSKLAELQSRLGELQGEIGSKMGDFGEQMGHLGELQGKLGEQQGELGEQQGKLASQLDQKVKSIMDESLKNGKARPVQ